MPPSCSMAFCSIYRNRISKEAVQMEKQQPDGRKAAMIVDIGMLVPKNHLLRKVDKAMDYD